MEEKLYESVVKFVKKTTKKFDESHDYKHAIAVYNTAKCIMDSMNIKYDIYILMFASLLHDVCDHKYPESISQEDLTVFIHDYIPDKVDIIMKIINNISYSKEVSGKREKIDYPYNIYLDAISDADRIEALGETGIRRCIIYNKSRGKDKSNVIAHCYEKLLRLYPEKFIKTDKGRELALPLHQYVVDYVKENE
jgi:HD superfamily phosphodiesterase